MVVARPGAVAGLDDPARNADIADPSVERDDHAVVILRGLHDDWVLASAELLIEHGVHIVPLAV